MLHELAFQEIAPLLEDLKKALGDELFVFVATDKELPARMPSRLPL